MWSPRWRPRRRRRGRVRAYASRVASTPSTRRHESLRVSRDSRGRVATASVRRSGRRSRAWSSSAQWVLDMLVRTTQSSTSLITRCSWATPRRRATPCATSWRSRPLGVLGGKLYNKLAILTTHSPRLPRRLPELEDLPHDAIVAELDEKFDGGVVPRGAVTAQRPAWRASERGATAGEKRPEAENFLVWQATVGRPASAARAHAGDQSLCFEATPSPRRFVP